MMTEDGKSDRRGFFLGAIYGFWAMIGAALALPAGIYLFAPGRSKEGEWIEAGPVSDLPRNVPEEVVFRRNRVDGWKVTSEKSTAWAVRTPDDKVIAFSPRCPHLGCAYHWEDEKHEFICPCHASTFSLDGKVLSGPAPRPLDRYEAKVEKGKLWLGPMQRSRETKS